MYRPGLILAFNFPCVLTKIAVSTTTTAVSIISRAKLDLSTTVKPSFRSCFLSIYIRIRPKGRTMPQPCPFFPAHRLNNIRQHNIELFSYAHRLLASYSSSFPTHFDFFTNSLLLAKYCLGRFQRMLALRPLPAHARAYVGCPISATADSWPLNICLLATPPRKIKSPGRGRYGKIKSPGRGRKSKRI